jgi:hypothetical protein
LTPSNATGASSISTSSQLFTAPALFGAPQRAVDSGDRPDVTAKATGQLPISPPVAQAAAQAKGQQRYENFVEVLGRRLQKGQSFLNEIPEDVVKRPSRGTRDGGEPS